MQPPRLLTIRTPLGDGALTVVKLSATEELGLPYAVEAEVLGIGAIVPPEKLLNQDVTITVTQRGPSPFIRHFHGMVAEFRKLSPGPANRMTYRLVLVPHLWRLGLRRNCRIWQDRTVKEIVTAVLKDHGLPEPSWNMVQAEAIPYCTQFNETDLAFVSRLLEEHGLSYYFKHSAGGHELCVAGAAASFPQGDPPVVVAVHGDASLDTYGQWRRLNRTRGFTTVLDDMDAERSRPSEVLSKTRPTRTYVEEPSMPGAAENYFWPGGMSTRPGLDPAEVSMSDQEARSEEYGAAALDPRHAVGTRVAVTVMHEDGSQKSNQFLITAARHEAVDNSGLVAGAGTLESYRANLALAFTARRWVPPPRHPRPAMPGMHSAKVTGPPGEKIHVDEFGRIKVKFRWDRWGKDDDTSSCWVRVMQSVAGSWGGAWYLPRVGDEVLVAFLDGDPDRPVVVGSVYGKDSPPPFKLPANKTQTGYVTRSYKSDSAADANILRFEDKKGSEEVLLHAQKDLTVEVEHDEERKVGHDQTEVVQNARTVTIKDSDDKLTLEKGNREDTIKMGNDTLSIDMGNRSTTLKMGNDTTELKMGNLSIKCDLGAVTIEAMQSITLKVGQSSIVVDQMGVTVKGMIIQSEAQLLMKLKALMLQDKADALAQIEGGIVMIN
ncbi:type VI secretion system tip protein VgrG [Roseomonas stagni]|uniref:Type VI secretion system tip protein VgrG n=1 Tax=Falsiroseomonas algicola TaxID=2716930 RepID=A0A6M1LIW2_9PROT|nr:type VI secretion system tip protein TssI/VgrG [Falsiroseomonas algicola]NGM19854.1 type VI secretion system tip protein VgrG [Falsiroseomonas algicola]